MKRNVIFLLMLLALLLPACGTAVPEIVPDVAVDPSSTKVAFVIAEPPTSTATFTPMPPTPEPSPTEVLAVIEAMDTPTLQPEPTATDTLTVEPSPTPEPNWLNNYGRTVDNLVYLGNPNAPVSIVDFSDFM